MILDDPEHTGVTPAVVRLLVASGLFVAVMSTTVASFIYPAVAPVVSIVRNAICGLQRDQAGACSS